jgi:1-acyl-sn-glycerol-3-phosphate acyltransferase
MVYTIIKTIFYILFKIFWKIEITGSDNIPKKGSLIVAPNHVSYLDPVIVGISMKRKVHFIAKKEVFSTVLGNLFFRQLNAFPVDRDKIDMAALKNALNLLQQGEILGIFPEGTRSMNGELKEFKLGIIKIAMKAGAPILPVGIIGVHKIYPRGKKFPTLFKHKIIVRFGSPISFSTQKTKDKIYQKESLNELSQKIKELI